MSPRFTRAPQWKSGTSQDTQFLGSVLRIADSQIFLPAQLLRQVDDARRDHVKFARFSFVGHPNGTAAVLVRTVDEARTQTVAAGRLQIVNVGRAHHHFLWS